jgi:hypothetical protein
MRAAIALRDLSPHRLPVKASFLPPGVLELLQIAAGDRALEARAARELGAGVEEIRASAFFFVEHVLLAPEADSFRALGATARSDAAELRRNMALLLRALHPDLHPDQDRSDLALRVTEAWNRVKTPSLRDRYDGERAASGRGVMRLSSRPNRRRRLARSRSSLPLVLEWILATLFGRRATRRR